LYRDPNIHREPDTYPILGAAILQDHLQFKLSKTFAHHYQAGVAEQNWCDLVVLEPVPILFEVDTLGGGKRSQFGSIAGESTAITDYHVVRQAGWFQQANKWCDDLLQITRDCEGLPLELANIVRQIEQKAQTDRIHAFMKELYLHHLELAHEISNHPGAAEIAQSLEAALERIGGRPGSIVIGTNYGWAEGMKSSARETSIENGTSLWTYRDLYEFLVRTDDWDIETRQQAFIDILAKNGGPACWHVAQL
jgi:hypothetical protein